MAGGGRRRKARGEGGRNPGIGSRPFREVFGHSTSKVPPYWEPSFEKRGYPFKVWVKDLHVWASGSELAEELRAPAVAQRVGGAARDLVREVPTNELRDGRTDPPTRYQDSGLTLVIRGLSRRFGQFAIETSTECIISMLTFRRQSTENVDEALSRFEALRQQVRTQATGFELPVPVTCWLLLEAMHIPRRTWPLVRAPWESRMPEDEPRIRGLCEPIRHQGHIAETPGNSWTKGSSERPFFEESDHWVAREGSHHDAYASEWETSEDPTDWGSYLEESVREPSVFYDDCGWAACSACGAYADEDDYNETDTESESELVGTPALTAYLGSFEGETSESLLNSYLLCPVLPRNAPLYELILHSAYLYQKEKKPNSAFFKGQ